MDKRMIFVSVLFAFAAETAEAIRCYKCDYQDIRGKKTGMANCGDTFSGDGVPIIETHPLTGDPCKVCTKSKGEQDDKDSVEYDRSCSSVSHSDGCGGGSFSGYESDLCYCKTDLCNSGNVAMMSVGAIVVSFSIYLLYLLI